MDLCDYGTIKRILARHGFSFSKALGQNFLIDGSVCPAMAKCLNAGSDTGVIEIGPGVGVLTKELCAVAGKVVAVELDKRLLPVLAETLAHCDNLEVVNADIMKLDVGDLIKEHFDGFKSVKVCANLPYYITSPVIMKLLESGLDIDEIVVMVQKEAGMRLCAEVGTRLSGAVTVAVSYYADSEVLFEVPRTGFYPSPKVDSVVIRLKLKKKKDIDLKDEKKFFNLVKCAFSQRRKTALNSVSATMGVDKASLAEIFDSLAIDRNIRAENLSMQQFADIAERL